MAGQLVEDDLWAIIEPVLPKHTPTAMGGRPRASDRRVLTGIVFVLRTGIPWEYLPVEFGCTGKTCWNRLREWHAAGVWTRVHQTLLERLHRAGAIDWSRASVDSAQSRAKKGARRRARTPRIAENLAQNIT
jgi:transposase